MSDERPDADPPVDSPADQPDAPAPVVAEEPPAVVVSDQPVVSAGDPTEVEPVPPPPPPESDNVVERWFDSYVRGSVAGQNVQVWNHLMEVKEHLKRMLSGG